MGRSLTLPTAALLFALSTGPALGQGGDYDAAVAALASRSAGDRREALERLGRSRRPEAAAVIAPLLRDDNDRVQRTAIDALLQLHLVTSDRDSLALRVWGPAAEGGRPQSLAEAAFEAGPLAAIPAHVPGDALTGLAAVLRYDEDPQTRLLAAYALGVLGAPHMGMVPDDTARQVATDVVYALQHPDVATREVVARVAGRLYRWTPGIEPPVAVVDALIGAMNDKDPLVRRWATDSLGWMRSERALQALTARVTYFDDGEEEGVAAVHAVARVAHPSSAPLLQALLTSRVLAYRVLAIEGLGRLQACDWLKAIDAAANRARDPAVPLAAHFARFLCGEGEIAPIVAALDRRETEQQARVYLEEIGTASPAALSPMLANSNPAIRELAVHILGASKDARQENTLQPLLHDRSREVVAAATEAIRRLRAYGGTAPAGR